MAGILATLGGNPLNTPVGQKIEQATDASLPSENWALNMEICDLINETDEGPKDAVKAIRKRLQQNTGKNYTVVLYALTVLETCVKNCGRRFHLLISQKDFTLDLVKLIGPKNDPPTAVQEKVLSLIQSWADAFQGNPEMQGVVQVYHDLKQKGIEFPMTDLDAMAPIHTPQRSVPPSSSPPPLPDQVPQGPQLQAHTPQPMPDVVAGQVAAATTPISLSPEQLGKLRSELDTVQGNMKVFGEMLTELTPGQEHPQDLELLQELQKTCFSMQNRIVDLIEKIGMEEVTVDLLRINDELNNLFLRYDRYDKKRIAVQSQAEPKLQGPPDASAATAENPLDKPLIDFGELNDDPEDVASSSQLAGLNIQDSASGGSNSSKDPKSKTASITDEFDMFAQSRNTSFEASKAKGSSYADNSNLDHIEGGLASFAQNKGKQDMFQVNAPASQDTVSNNVGFDKFLNDRMGCGERLTNIPSVQAATSASSPITMSSSVNNRRQIDKDDAENSLFAL